MLDFFGHEIRVGDTARLVEFSGEIYDDGPTFHVLSSAGESACIAVFTHCRHSDSVAMRIKTSNLAVCASSLLAHEYKDKLCQR